MATNVLDSLSPEYRALMEEQMKQREIARAMLQQGLAGPQMPTNSGKQMSRLNPLAALAPVLQAYLGKKGDSEASAKMMDIQKQANSATEFDTNALMNAPDPKAAAMRMLNNPNPRVSGLAQQLYKQQLEQEAAEKKYTAGRTEKAIEALAQSGNTAGAYDLARTGQFGPYSPPVFKEPTFETRTENGKTFALTRNYDKHGRPNLSATAGSTDITNKVNTAGEVAALEAGGKKVPEIMEKTMTEARAGVDQRDKAQRLFTLASDPQVITGAFAEPRHFLSNLATLLNFQGPEGPAKTQQLMAGLAEQTLDASNELKGAITEKEWPKLAAARAGDINWTPQALQQLSALAMAKAHNQTIRAHQQRNGALGFKGADQVATMYPMPSYGSAQFPKELFDERPDGTVVYKGGVGALISPGVKGAPVLKTSPGSRPPPQKMTKEEIAAEIRQLEQELFQNGRR